MNINEYSAAGELVSRDKPLTQSNLHSWYPRIDGIRWNYVINKNEKYDSNSDLASNDLDRKFLLAIRESSDLIITTGKTARTESLNSSKFAPILILTKANQIDVPATRNLSTHEVIVAGTEGFKDFLNPKARSIRAKIGNLPFWLKEFCSNYESVVLESGMATAKELIDARLVSEIDLTISLANTFTEARQQLSEFLKVLEVEPKIFQVLSADSTWFFRCQVS